MTTVEARPFQPQEYTPPIPGNLFDRYKSGLATIKRWDGDTGPSRMPENTLEHTVGTIAIVDEVRRHFPNLSGTLKLDSVKDMLWLHDGPEIVVGDHYMGDPKFLLNRKEQKAGEQAAAMRLVRFIADPQEKARVEELFNRYDDCKPDDLESNFAHLLDKFQGTRFGLQHGGIPSLHHVGHTLTDEEINKRRNNASLSLTTIEKFAQPLMTVLEGKALDEIKQFTLAEVTLFTTHGFGSEAEQTISSLQLNLNNGNI